MQQFSRDELQRYMRHFSLKNVGMDGQKKLKQAKVLLIGAGGLANPAALYLSAAGIGCIGIIDDDVVDLSNLQRQVAFSTNDIGAYKVNALKTKLQALNPNITVNAYQEKFTEANACACVKNYDVVIDCTDNFPTRYLVNDACWIENKPNVYASISQFEGQCTVFAKGYSPCYRCLYPAPPPSGLIPNCAEGGVFGVLPGLLGTLQAMQALNIILAIGEPLYGRLFIFNALNFETKILAYSQNPDCELCVKSMAFDQLSRPTEQCDIADDVPQITIDEFKQLKQTTDLCLLDVREPYEYDADNMEGQLIPLNELAARIDEIDTTKPIVVHCQSGLRSAKAVKALAKLGIKAISLEGGLQAWKQSQ